MKNIILTGLPGSGKTSVAVCLKNIFPDFTLAEVDILIVERENLSVNKIFEIKGEKYFRTIEKHLIDKLLERENQIISLGGGSLENNFNFDKAKKNSLIFYLKADVNILFERLKGSNDRPLLKCDNPKEKLSELLNKREENYKKSDFIIDVNNIDVEKTAKKIEEIYKNENRDN
ncbi:AAA family ATPase [bacterium]|nr:AAA family ATPase [bacterium]